MYTQAAADSAANKLSQVSEYLNDTSPCIHCVTFPSFLPVFLLIYESRGYCVRLCRFVTCIAQFLYSVYLLLRSCFRWHWFYVLRVLVCGTCCTNVVVVVDDDDDDCV